jgi:phospholipid/cholesterol/gamma-HCH transport system substrate-binding protein
MTARRPRFVREGSVGLLAIAGVMALVTGGLWLKGHTFGAQSYKVFVDFFAVSGIQVGAPVRFRGIKVGRVTSIRPGTESAEIELTISAPDTIIPRAVLVEANQSGLISETSIDFTPLRQVAAISRPAITGKPTDSQCDSTVMICAGDRLKGEVGVSLDELIRTSVRFAEVYGDPIFLKNLNQAITNASTAASNLATLSTEMTGTAKSLKSNLLTTSESLQTNMTALQTNVSGLSQDLRGQIPALSSSVKSVGQAANRISTTTGELGGLLTQNRSQIEVTLKNFGDASEEFKVALGRVSPILQKVEQGKILDNLETFSANAAKASVSLRGLVDTASNPGTMVVLYQLLDSARATFQNTQKLTSDLDEVTGDPTFRRNLRELVKGLSKLISSAETLDQQTQVARRLAPGANSLLTPSAQELSPKIASLVAPFHIADSAVTDGSKSARAIALPATSSTSLPPSITLNTSPQPSALKTAWQQVSTVLNLLNAIPSTSQMRPPAQLPVPPEVGQPSPTRSPQPLN